jgi:hypothetical protein
VVEGVAVFQDIVFFFFVVSYEYIRILSCAGMRDVKYRAAKQLRLAVLRAKHCSEQFNIKLGLNLVT